MNLRIGVAPEYWFVSQRPQTLMTLHGDNMKILKNPSQDRLKSIFFYDKFYGSLVCKETGRYAGSKPNNAGYIQVSIKSQIYLSHRLILIYHGYMVEGMSSDHINGNKSDNRIENLRVVDQLENSRNQRVRISNNSGFTGVSWDSVNNKWRVTIKVKGKQIAIGRYVDLNDAINARISANELYGFHKNHGVNINA